MQNQRSKVVPGLVLVLLGIAFLLRDYFSIGPEFLLIVAGVIFFVAYIFSRMYGVLIPGMLLLGLGAGLVYQRSFNSGSAVPLGLGVGFIAIYIIDLLVSRTFHRWWPVIPGGALMIPGIIDTFPIARVWVEKGWPVILIVVGLFLLILNFVPKSVSKPSNQ
jgi:hypothetical protein